MDVRLGWNRVGGQPCPFTSGWLDVALTRR